MDNSVVEPSLASGEMGFAKPAKKGGKVAVVFAVLFALIATSLGVWIAIIILNPEKKSEEDCQAQQEPMTNDVENDIVAPEEITSKRNDEKIRKLVKDVETAWAKAAVDYGMTQTNYDNGTIIPISDSVQTVANRSYGFSAIKGFTTDHVEKNRAVAEESIASQVSKSGLKKIDKPANFNILGADNENFYGNDEIFCYSAWGSGLAYYQFSCADKSWYSSDADKELDLALAKAYNEKEKDYKLGYINASTSDIKTNSAGTYETIVASINDAVALFYRKKGTADWKYFTSTQSEIPCVMYNTSELKEAYRGEKCDIDKTIK